MDGEKGSDSEERVSRKERIRSQPEKKRQRSLAFLGLGRILIGDGGPFCVFFCFCF